MLARALEAAHDAWLEFGSRLGRGALISARNYVVTCGLGICIRNEMVGMAWLVIRALLYTNRISSCSSSSFHREALLIAIAKARQWIDDLAHGRADSFAVIARREGKAEWHIRLLAPLAFVSPRIVSALLDGTAPVDLTLTKLARALPYCWAEQERRVGPSAPVHC